MSWKNSVLVRSEMFGLFVKTLTVEYKYSRRNRQNFAQQLQTQLSQKRIDFSLFLIALPQCKSNLESFDKKDESSSLSIFEIVDSERSGYLIV